ncbi:hypothetical protein CJ030_MR6G019639 [Morella rubra]|uniref:DUF4220 domain-containing protein n=1 Tax=Morella rubra TaxID=262757 RepID=A0A6A1VIU6_9ROSI|nr:hypothetical protein CJ030_MR6G019639 [Morella rubra]
MNPIPYWARKLWNAWDIRFMILLSFILQVTLLILGSRRKYSARTWISIVVWAASLMADWVATTALGNLTQAQIVDSSNLVHPTNELKALWAPLLLLHLGRPGIIAAYAFEDNSLWLRHLVAIIVQLVLAIYVILLPWTTSWLSFLTFPLLLAGVVKNGERVWILRLAGGGWISGNIPHSEWEDENLGYSCDAENSQD